MSVKENSPTNPGLRTLLRTRRARDPKPARNYTERDAWLELGAFCLLVPIVWPVVVMFDSAIWWYLTAVLGGLFFCVARVSLARRDRTASR